MADDQQREFSVDEKYSEHEALQKAESFCDKLFGERYRVSSVIGYGGMGYVLKAHDTQLNRTVAIKVLHRNFVSRERVLRRFVEEARTLASIKDKTNIVEVYDISRDDTPERPGNWYVDESGHRYPWFVMEYLEGDTLDTIIELRERFTPQGAYSYLAQIFDGLTVAHAQKVVHRDLKPENIKVVDDRVPYVIKIMDFGISRILADDGGGSTSDLTTFGEKFGTPHYMSPEQARGDITQIKAPSDLYSVGVMLFCMLTGKFPFDSVNYLDIMTMHMRDEPPPASSINSAVSPKLDRIILKAMAKNPADRWQSAAEFKAALREAIFGDEEPLPATSKPPIELKNALMERDPAEEETVPANVISVQDIRTLTTKQAALPDPVEVERPTIVSSPPGPKKKPADDQKSSPLGYLLVVSVAAIVIGFAAWVVVVKGDSCASERIEIAPANTVEKSSLDKLAAEVTPKEEAVRTDTLPPDEETPDESPPVEPAPHAFTVADMKKHDQIAWNGIQTYQGTKRCLMAEATLDILIERYPEFPDPHFWRAQCYAATGKKKQAAEQYRLFLKAAPEDHELVPLARKALKLK